MLLHVFAKRDEFGLPKDPSLIYDDLWLESELIEAKDIVEDGVIKGKDFRTIGPNDETLKHLAIYYCWYGYELLNDKKEIISKVVLVH